MPITRPSISESLIDHIVPIEVEPIDMETIDAVPIALDPLDREPTLLSRSTQSLACSKPIFNNYCAIMNILLTGSDYHGPI